MRCRVPIDAAWFGVSMVGGSTVTNRLAEKINATDRGSFSPKLTAQDA
jgi:hypothetical protein